MTTIINLLNGRWVKNPRRLWKNDMAATPSEYGSDEAKCLAYGGNCMADGCRHWFPLPSPDGRQEAACEVERNYAPVTLKEAARKARHYAAGALASMHMSINFRAQQRQHAEAWRKLAQELESA